MQDRVVNVIRVCQLEETDRFLYSGQWRIVLKIEDGVLTYCNLGEGNRDTISANSKQFVEVKRFK